MKVQLIQLEGDPSEIIQFFQKLPAFQGFRPEVSISALATANQSAELLPSQQAEAPNQQAVEPEAPAAVEPQTPAPDQSSQVNLTITDDDLPPISEVTINRQAPIKDQITQFLEQRRRGKVKDITEATGLSHKIISPRISELVAEGYVRRLTNTKFDNVYEFIRPWESKGPSKRNGSPFAAPEEAKKVAEEKQEQLRVEIPQEPVQQEPVQQPLVQEPVQQEPLVLAEDESDDEGLITVKDRIVSFLKEWGEPASAGDIRLALELPSRTITSRLVYAVRDGLIEKLEPNFEKYGDRFSRYRLVGNGTATEPVVEQQAPVIAPVEEEEDEPAQQHIFDTTDVTPEQVECLRLMDALATSPGSSYYDLERVTGMPREIISRRMLALEQRDLVERSGGRRSGPVIFTAYAPTRKNQLPLKFDLEAAIIETLRKHPGSTEEQVSIRLMKALYDVQTKLATMEHRGVITRRGGGADARWHAKH